MISMIACIGENREIGKDNDMPWKRGLPADLDHFKKVTMGKKIIMGRKTYESIGRPLPGRKNIILTRDKTYQKEGFEIINDVKGVLELAEKEDDEIFIIGGAELYSLFLPYSKRLYITKINQRFDADTFFPYYDEGEYNVVSKERGIRNEKNNYDFEFITYEK